MGRPTKEEQKRRQQEARRKAQIKWNHEYQKKHCKRVTLIFNPGANEEDREVLEQIGKQPNKSAYIKGLILADKRSREGKE